MVDDGLTDKEVVDGDDDIDFFDSRDDAADNADDADDGSYSEGAPATKKKRKKGATAKRGGKEQPNATMHVNTKTHQSTLI